MNNSVRSLDYLALAGPTAAGKTAAALAISRQYPVEIISVDSALVYRSMDIGTAKPSADELAAVPHHLINIRDPLQAYSAAEFVTDAQRLIQEIRARGKLPLLVGGTMLYFKALFDGLDEMPKADPAVRAILAAEAAARGWPALHAELALVDPITAARLQPNDSQRISRALEVFRVSGQPLSFFQRRIAATSAAESPDPSAVTASAARQSMTAGLPRCARNDDMEPSGLLISLEPNDRAWLHGRIAERFDAMLGAGFLDEVRSLRARGDLHPDLPSMRCVGYRQAWALLDSIDAREAQAKQATDVDLNTASRDFREQGIAATRQLAKRQLTWLRSMPQRRVVACDATDALAQVLALVTEHVSAAVSNKPS
ncbi:MAG: tRNA (adenosine(37)-N6)-dimethylallyltransferase MiaA [Polaromonas sp.]|nr:tRNA (adenosine(37)-N6)-dimethylallyltransferase MiaA [Polaromonas sp.]